MSKSKFGTAKTQIPDTEPVKPLPLSDYKKQNTTDKEKVMNFKWRFDFVIPTGIMQESVTIEVCAEIDSERVAFGLALNKIISTEKYKSSTGVPRYTQKFTKEKITQE